MLLFRDLAFKQSLPSTSWLFDVLRPLDASACTKFVTPVTIDLHVGFTIHNAITSQNRNVTSCTEAYRALLVRVDGGFDDEPLVSESAFGGSAVSAWSSHALDGDAG